MQHLTASKGFWTNTVFMKRNVEMHPVIKSELKKHIVISYTFFIWLSQEGDPLLTLKVAMKKRSGHENFFF